MERLLIALADEEEKLLSEAEALQPSTVTLYEERLRVWPPWPWPPWDGEDPEDPDDPDGPRRGPGGPNRPKNPKKWAKKLAKDIVKFEKRIAAASLDL